MPHKIVLGLQAHLRASPFYISLCISAPLYGVLSLKYGIKTPCSKNLDFSFLWSFIVPPYWLSKVFRSWSGINTTSLLPMFLGCQTRGWQHRPVQPAPRHLPAAQGSCMDHPADNMGSGDMVGVNLGPQPCSSSCHRNRVVLFWYSAEQGRANFRDVTASSIVTQTGGRFSWLIWNSCILYLMKNWELIQLLTT